MPRGNVLTFAPRSQDDMIPKSPNGPDRSRSGGERGLPSARERAPEGREHRATDGPGRTRRGRERDRRPKPKPARALSAAAPQRPAGEPEPAEAEFEAEGTSWTVRVLGRSAGGRGVGGASLMLLGFWKGAPPDASAPPELEHLTVARALSGMSPRELHEALARAHEPAPAGRAKPFFPDPRERRRR